MSEEQPKKFLDIDGHRPVDESDFEIKKTLNIDGQRPVVSESEVFQKNSM